MPSRRTILTGLAAMPLVPLTGFGRGGTAMAQQGGTMIAPDTLESSAGSITIQPINHATLTLSVGDAVLLFDPVGGAARYEGLAKPTAILVTHQHQDHFDVPTLEALAGPDTPLIVTQIVFDALSDKLKAQAKAYENGASGTVAGFAFEAVPMYNLTEDRLKYHPKGMGNGYVLTIGDKKLHVAGDTEPVPELEALEGIDVAFLPMNLPYTETGEQAAALAKAYKPKVVYPYHYGKGGAEPAKFAAAMEGEPGVEVRQRDWYAYG